MKKFFLVSVSMLLILFLGFGIWFGVSYSKNGLAKTLYDKFFNVQDSIEEPTEEPEEPQEPEEPEESENYAYKIVVNKPEDVAVPETGTMRNVKVGEVLGGKWYAVDMQRFNLEMTAGDLSFNNGVGGETYAYVNNFFGIQVFTIENGFLFYLPETFEGSYLIGYDVVNEVEVNETLTLSWNSETLIDTVSEGIYVVEESERELVFPYDISAYNLDVTIPEGVEVPQTGTLRKVEIGETLGGKWYAVDYNQIKLEGITSNFMKSNDIHIRGFYIDVGIDTFVSINSYSLIESKIINGVSMFYLPESLTIDRHVGYDSYSEVLINAPRNLSWTAETVIEDVCPFVYVVEESQETLAYPYATDEAYCAYKMDVTIPEGVEAPQSGTLRKVEVGEYLGGKWYAVDIERRKSENVTGSLISSHGMNFTLYNGCTELDTLVCMNTFSGVECIAVNNVTMFYLPESVNVVRNVGYDKHNSKMYNSTRRFSWNATSDITAVGEYVYVVETGDGELRFPVIETVGTLCFDEFNYTATSGDVYNIPVYSEFNGEKGPYTGKLNFYITQDARMNVYNNGELVAPDAPVSESEGLYTINVEFVDSKFIVNATCVKTKVDGDMSYELIGDAIEFFINITTENNPDDIIVLSYRCAIAE